MIKNAKNTIKLGLLNTTGMFAIGKISNGKFPALEGNINTGLQLTQIGQLSKNTLDLTNMFSSKKNNKIINWRKLK
jgi:hypothetical protein